MQNLRLSGNKFQYRDSTPEKLLEQVNLAYDFLRQYQTQNDELRAKVLKQEERIKFWRNLTLTGLIGLLTTLLAFLKAAAPYIVKKFLQ